MTERALLANVLAMAQWLGYRTYHTWRSDHSVAGYPDLTLVGHGRLVVAELKSDRGRISSCQQRWLDEFALAGIPAYIWRPRDWLDGSIEQALR